MSVSTTSRSPGPAFGSDFESFIGSPGSCSLPTSHSRGHGTPEFSQASPLVLSPSISTSLGMDDGSWWDMDVKAYGHGDQEDRFEQRDRVDADQTACVGSIGMALDCIAGQALHAGAGFDASVRGTPASLDALDITSPSNSLAENRMQRRQGVTCDHCRSKHIRCVPATSDGGDPLQHKSKLSPRCQRCVDKDLVCTRTYRPPSRRYPRPSRTGKRIEQARVLHGSIDGAPDSFAASVATGPSVIFERLLQPQVPHQSNMKLHNDILAGSTSLRLLTCFFATAHMQMPIVDFHNFSARYNFAHGDCRIMSLMARGGDDVQHVPAARQSAPGLVSTTWPPGAAVTASTTHSTLSSPGTTEALIAAMHAWAALYTDMPIAFGTAAATLPLRTQTHAAKDASEIKQLDTALSPKIRRPKRKQGVACDTCRLRRLRCDKLERPEGSGCTRCEDKRIVCTDEYIQAKRKKTAAKELSRDEKDAGGHLDSADTLEQRTFIPRFSVETDSAAKEDEGVVGSCSAHARDVPRGSGPASWDASAAQTEWIDSGPSLPEEFQFGQARRMLAYGKARQPFFCQLLQRAMMLVYEHKLLEQPSIEAIQAMSILVQVLDMVTPSGTQVHDMGSEGDSALFADACCRHTRVLGLESTDEVDEQDQSAVEQLLSAMQRKRLWSCVWTRDALVAGLFRRKPSFAAERALGIRGTKSRIGVQPSNSSRETKDATLGRAGLPSPLSSSQEAGPELNGEMGLSFSILAVMQIGALSRFAGKHLDNIQAPSDLDDLISSTSQQGQASSAVLQSPAMRFPLLPSHAEMRRLSRACSALWKSIDALLLFFDKCALAAQHQMDSLHAFQPLGWIATIKVAAVMLDLCSFRILTERVQLAQTFMLAMGASSSLSASEDALSGNAGIHVLTPDDYARFAELQRLQQLSQQRTFLGCRKTAKLTEHLLGKQVYQTGGLILRHIVLVAQFLARSPCVHDLQHVHAGFVKAPSEGPAAFQSTEQGTDGLNDASIDPRKLSDSAAPDAATAPRESPTMPLNNRASGQGVPDALFTTELEPFDVQRKQHEVAVCLEAVAQLGYAWPGMDAEISIVEEIMMRGGSAGSSASSGSSTSAAL